jgi:hypothetical protein
MNQHPRGYHNPNTGESGTKRKFENMSELIAAGLVQTGDETHISTNVVNLSTFDGTPQHGLPCNFNQNRTTQIIGNTSRSQVGIVSAEIQTKTLPVFQPQVKLGTDVDTLIYEVGYSAVWSGCLLNGSQIDSTLSILTDDTEAQIQRQQRAGAPTFQNDFGSVQVYDAYNNSFTLPTMDNGAKHTLLKAFIDYHVSSSSALFQNTPFKPFLIPSRFEPMITLLPLRTEANNATITGAYAVVKDASGFTVGDRVHLLGHSSTANNTAYSIYAQITSICTYSDLIITGSMKNPSSDNPNIITSTVLVFAAIAGITATEVRTGGYVINTHISDAGGQIQFLVDEFEFRPRTATLVSSSDITASNNVTVTVTAAANTLGQGFLRKDNWPVPVEFTSTDQPELNGVYTVQTITGSSPFTVVLKPLTITALTVASYTAKTGILKLAPNGYTVDRRVLNSTFLNCIGYQPSSELEICIPAYPPSMTRTTRSWKRAYSVELAFSTYRNLRWQTQDVDVRPNAPEIQQDFGIDSGSSYYNVYDFQQFIDTSVNPILDDLLTESNPNPLPSFAGQQLELDNLSLNQQLQFVSSAYQSAFVSDPALLAYNPATNYLFGAAVIYSGYVWTPQKDGLLGLPPDPYTANWYRIGDAPNTANISRNLVFVYTASQGMTFTCPGVTNVPTTPEKVRKMNIPTFKTKPITFSYSGPTNLLSYKADINGFGTTFNRDFFDSLPASKFSRNLGNYNYMSWGLKNATGQGGDETIKFESNSHFKFLFDNFPCRSIRYVEPTTNGLLVYWLWDQNKDDFIFAGDYTQASESLSSSVSPIQSIVILSKTVPVVQTLLSPAYVITDTNITLGNSTGVVGNSDSILGEFYISPGMLSSCRSVIRYQPEQVSMYSLQSTKVFKQFDYIVCYRHRITQKLVPLNLSNYGSVNIKFVFKPT